MTHPKPPSLRLSHTTVAVRDLDAMIAFYRDVLGFHVTNRGAVGDGALAFLSQDPTEHHQMVFITGMGIPDHEFMLADHLAFRTGDLDDLRAIGERLARAGVEGVMPVSHGNAWSLYFTDPEGNGLECFVDSPYHVAQPHLEALDIGASNDEIDAATRAQIEELPEFQPLEEWQHGFAERLAAGRA